jgi:hypothetical protein
MKAKHNRRSVAPNSPQTCHPRHMTDPFPLTAKSLLLSSSNPSAQRHATLVGGRHKCAPPGKCRHSVRRIGHASRFVGCRVPAWTISLLGLSLVHGFEDSFVGSFLFHLGLPAFSAISQVFHVYLNPFTPTSLHLLHPGRQCARCRARRNDSANG